MSTKPASLPRWANVGGAIIVPSSGEQDVGWIDGDPAPAEHANWLANLAYQWLEYLNAGYIDMNDVYHGNRTMVLEPGNAVFPAAPNTVSYVADNTNDGDMYLVATATAGVAFYAIPLNAGDRIVSVRAELYGDAVGSAVVSVARHVLATYGGSMASVQAGTSSATLGAAWDDATTHTLSSDGYDIVAGEKLYVRVGLPGDWRAGKMHITWDRPRP